MNGIKTISSEDLKAKMDNNENFKLVMTYHEWAFNAKHIPGSLNIYSVESAAGKIDPSDEIIVYCVNEICNASITAYRILESQGFNKIVRFAGGLEAWEAAGYKLEGNDINKTIEVDDNFLK